MATTEYVDRTMKHLLAESKRVGWPEIYESDLVHDHRFIADHPNDMPFGWMLGPCGTHMLTGHDDVDRHLNKVRLYVGCIVRAAGRPLRCYFWDGCRLHFVTADEMVDRMREARKSQDAEIAIC